MKLLMNITLDYLKNFLKHFKLILILIVIVSNGYLIKETEVYKKAQIYITQFWGVDTQIQKVSVDFI